MKLPRGAFRVFAITWTAYATYYLARKNLGVVKARLAAESGVSIRTLAIVGAAYLTAYAIGQFVSGWAGDKLGARRLLGIGLLGSAASCVVFGVSSSAGIFLVAYAVNGLAQSTGWPGTNKAVAAWTTPSTRGKVMGVWATCYQVGGIAATSLATFALVRWGWRAAFLLPAGVLVLVAWLVLTRLENAPATPPDDDEDRATEGKNDTKADRKAVLLSPIVWSYGASYFAIKMIRYSLLSWLPYYLRTALHYDEGAAGYLSNAFEMGGVVGTIGLGAISDRLRHVPRAMVAGTSLVLLAPALWAYGSATSSMAINVAAMAVVGALLFGPDALLSGAASQDLGGNNGAALAVGIVNGIGSIGAIVQEPLTVWISERWGWGALFHVFLVAALVAAIALVPALRATRSARSRRARGLMTPL